MHQQERRHSGILKTAPHKHTQGGDHVKFDKVIVAEVELPADIHGQDDPDNVKMHDEETKHEAKISVNGGEAVVIVEKEISVDEQEREA